MGGKACWGRRLQQALKQQDHSEDFYFARLQQAWGASRIGGLQHSGSPIHCWSRLQTSHCNVCKVRQEQHR